VIDGDGIPSPANRFHISLYEARSDITCVVHTHPLYTSALSMLGTPLTISHMDTCILYDDVGFLMEWPGVPVSYDEGKSSQQPWAIRALLYLLITASSWLQTRLKKHVF
jgi:L-fuculose-phosphate aldolase